MLLDEARERTLQLVAPVSDPDLHRVHHPLMSPLVWDLGHIAAYEDLWVCHRTGGLDLLHPELAELYDAFETPRNERGDKPYLRRDDGTRIPVGRTRALARGPGRHGARPPRLAARGPARAPARRDHAADAATGRLRGVRARARPGRRHSGHRDAERSRRRVRGGLRRPRLRLRQRAAPPSGGAAPVRDRPGAGDERGLRRLRRGRRLQAAGAVVRPGLGAPPARRLGASALLDRRRHGAPFPPRGGGSSRSCR